MRKKISFDVDVELYYVLETIQKKYELREGKKLFLSSIISSCILYTLGSDNDIKKALLTKLKDMQRHYIRLAKLSDENDYHYNDYIEKTNVINGLIDVFSDFGEIMIDKKSEFHKTTMKNGYLKYPSEWIVINEIEAKNSNSAYVVECRNSEEYDIPHYVMFANEEDSEKNVTAFNKKFFNLIVKKDNYFKMVLEKQVKLLQDDDGNYLNADEYLAQPQIGVFRVNNSDDIKKRRKIDENYNPPYGAEVVLKDKSE